MSFCGLDSQSNRQSEPAQYDTHFRGPSKKRSCTDIICLLIFIVFLCGWGFVAYFAYQHGNLNRLLVPFDSNGLRCGLDSKVLHKPYLVFFDLSKCANPKVPLTGCPTSQVCVEKCPEEKFQWDKNQCQASDFLLYKNRLICDIKTIMDTINNCEDIKLLIEAERCAKWYLKSQAISRRCIPSETNDALNGTIDQIRLIQAMENLELFATLHGFGQILVEDIINSWPLVVGALIGSMLICLLFIVIMRWLAAPVIWFSIFGVMALLGTGAFFSHLKYDYLKNNLVDRPPPVTNLSALFESYLLMKETWLYILIGLSILMVIIVLAIIILRKRIVIAVALVNEGSKAVSSITSTVFFPIFLWILQIFCIAFTVLCGLYLASIGTEVFKVSGMNTTTSCVCTGRTYVNGEICDPAEFNKNCKITGEKDNKAQTDMCIDAACHFIQIQSPTIVSFFHGVNIFGFFWTVFFISAFGEMVLAATFATWYWTFKKSEVPFFALTSGLSRTLRYHLGTVAFGSFIIAVCRIIRVILEYIHQKCKKYDNEVTRAILCIFRCVFWLLEKFLRFLNRNAYIMCAIHGKNFCSSTGDAFNLLMRNFLGVVALDQVTNFLFLLSKLLISSGMGALMFFYLSLEHSQLNLHYKIVPSVLVVIGTYFIACIFFSVYSLAAKTLLFCFLEDSERNDGSPERPYFMSKQLKKILKKDTISHTTPNLN